MAARHFLTGVAVACALLLLLSAPVSAFAAALRGGAPLSTRYTAQDHPGAPDNLAVVGDPRGMVWIGNSDGLLRYASGRFELIELPGGSPARALGIGADGRLYVGGYDRVGYVDIGADGEARYVDLVAKFASSLASGNVGSVWDVLVAKDAIYYRAERDLLRLGYDGAIAQWTLPDNLRGVQIADDVIYGRLEGEGLAQFRDGQFVPVAGGEAFANRSLIGLVGSNDGYVAVANDGFYRIAPQGLQRIATRFDADLRDAEPYVAIRLSDGSYLIGTTTGELFHVATDFTLIGRHTLDGQSITALGTDREGGVWVGTEASLLRVLLPSPWSIFATRDGLRGRYIDTAFVEGQLWVATSLGLFRRSASQAPDAPFESVEPFRGEVWDLEPTEHGVLIASTHGLHYADDRGVRAIGDAPEVFEVARSRHTAGAAFALGDTALVMLEADRDGYHVRTQLTLDGSSLSSLVEGEPGEVWLGDYRGAPWRVTNALARAPQAERIGGERGFVLDPEHGSHLFALDDRLVAASGKSLQMWDGARFETTGAQGLAELVDRPMDLRVRETAAGAFALTSRQLLHRERASELWQPVLLDSPLARGFEEIVGEPGGVLRLVTWHGVLQFDPNVPTAPKPELYARLRRAEMRSPDGVVNALPVTDGDVRVAPRHLLRFEFELLSAEPGREFRYRIVGLDDDWRPWSNEAELALPVLPPGDYRLDLEARLKSGRTARPFRYRFTMQPLWYEHNGARTAVALAIALLILAGSRWYAVMRVRTVEHRSRKLESVIADRTRELERANLQLARLAGLDGLTGVPNRRGFDAFLDQHWAACTARQAPLSLIMIDVDHFKQFNDRHGHLAGDEALRAIALELSRFASGEHEMLARFGGEEFAMVIDDAPLDAARARAEYIRAHFAERAERDGLTLSIGVATLVPELGVPPRHLIDLADAALYQAKRNGRNRVEAHRAAA